MVKAVSLPFFMLWLFDVWKICSLSNVQKAIADWLIGQVDKVGSEIILRSVLNFIFIFIRRIAMENYERVQKEISRLEEEHKQIMKEHKQMMKDHEKLMKYFEKSQK